MPVLSRILGVTTIATGVLEFAKPDLWAEPTGIGPAVPRAARLAPHARRPRRDLRPGDDLRPRRPGAARGDALPDRLRRHRCLRVRDQRARRGPAKGKAAGVALGYAAVNALSLRWAGR